MWNESLTLENVTTKHDIVMFYLMLTLCCIQALTLLICALVWKAEAHKKRQRLHCLEMILQHNHLSLMPISQRGSQQGFQQENFPETSEMCDSCRMLETGAFSEWKR